MNLSRIGLEDPLCPVLANPIFHPPCHLNFHPTPTTTAPLLNPIQPIRFSIPPVTSIFHPIDFLELNCSNFLFYFTQQRCTQRKKQLHCRNPGVFLHLMINKLCCRGGEIYPVFSRRPHFFIFIFSLLFNYLFVSGGRLTWTLPGAGVIP